MLSIREDHAVAAWTWIAETRAIGKQNDLLDCAGFHRFVLPPARVGLVTRSTSIAISGTTDADNRNLKKER